MFVLIKSKYIPAIARLPGFLIFGRNLMIFGRLRSLAYTGCPMLDKSKQRNL